MNMCIFVFCVFVDVLRVRMLRLDECRREAVREDKGSDVQEVRIKVGATLHTMK